MEVIVQGVLLGMLVMIAGTIPRNLLFAANLRVYPGVPWAVPLMVLHTAGNLYSNFDLWLHGQAEWQAASAPTALVWKTGADASFWMSILALLLVTAATVWAYFRLARVGTAQP